MDIADFKIYFDQRFNDLETAIEKDIRNLSEKIQEVITFSKEERGAIKKDIIALYDHDHNHEIRIAQIEEARKTGQRYTMTIIAVLSVCVAASGIVIGVLI